MSNRCVQSILMLAAGASLALLSTGLPVTASPLPQEGDIIPTPTAYPPGDLSYALSTVGGKTVEQTFPGMTQDGITVDEITVVSQYPRGIVFTMRASSTNGEIENATLFLGQRDGSVSRVETTWDADNQVWRAHLWPNGHTFEAPAWRAVDAFWRVRDSAGAQIETETFTALYDDPTREWLRAETDQVIVYWFGADEIPPETVAERAAASMSATEPMRTVGFGGPLNYKPVAVLYPSDDTLNEIVASGTTMPTAGGWASPQLGMVVLNFTTEPPPTQVNQDCVWRKTGERPTVEWKLLVDTMGNGIPHEVTHLRQYQSKASKPLPNWWFEGQASFFGYDSGASWQYDTRLRHLATLADIPSLDGDNISRETPQADGCAFLVYDVGQSFLNWFVYHYGLDTHAQVVALYQQNDYTLYTALQEATGESFLDLENAWRRYIGFPEITPAAALEDPVNPIAAVGDKVILSTKAFQYLLYGEPGSILASGACFPGATVTILRVGSLEGVDYYEVDCMGMVGWMTANQLNPDQ